MSFLKQIDCAEGTTCLSLPLEKRKVIKKALSNSMFIFIFAFIWLIILTGSRWINDPTLGHPALLTRLFIGFFAIYLLLFLFVLVYESFYYRYYYYDLSQQYIVIRKGVISRAEINIDYTRIQNVFIDQDFLDRLFGLYDVHIATADVQSARAAHIDGVNKENAELLKNNLLRYSKQNA